MVRLLFLQTLLAPDVSEDISSIEVRHQPEV